jgi:hypothetical protein
VDSRARYDRTLALEAETEFHEAVAFALKGLPRLDLGTRSALMDEASRRGVVPERAEILITRGCRASGISRDGAPALILNSIDPPRYLRCRSCSGVTEFADASPPNRPECRHCRGPLQWTCPSCKRVRWVDEPKCPCGFPLEYVEPLVRHFEAAQRAHRARDYFAAREHLEQVRRYAPDHPGARKGLDLVRRHESDAESARSACELARARRHLVGARAAVLNWSRLVPPDSPEFIAARDEVARGLRMAQSLAAKGRAAEADDPAKARTYYEKALAIAADLDDAREGLRRCPPEGPSNLSAEFDGDRVRLRWSPPAPDGLGPVKFRVVRKRQGVPNQPNDGAIVAEVPGSEAEDRGVQPGELVGYAVFTVRGEVASRLGAMAGPVASLPDVRDLRVEGRSGEVELTWTLPDRASGVRVVRNPRRRPVHDRDGDPVEALPNGALDRGLINDRAYHYAIFALYPGPDGVDRPSKGLSVIAVPHPPVEAPPCPSLARDADGRVRLTWPAPARGSIKIIRSSRPLPNQPGDRLPIQADASWPGERLGSSAPDRAEDPSPPMIGVCFYTPIIEWNGWITVGHPARYSCVADPSDLRAVRVSNGGRVHLRWRWSPQGTESVIVAKAGSPPIGADDPGAIVESIMDDEYSRLGFFGMTLPTGVAGPWHLAVFSVATVQGERVVSPGLEPSARTVVPGPNPEVTVSYVLRKPGFSGKNWSLTFQTDPAGASIPPTALVAHPRTVPLSADDGEIVRRFPASKDGETFTIQPTVDLSRHRARVFADPHANPDGLPPIRLRHPEGGTTRA